MLIKLDSGEYIGKRIQNDLDRNLLIHLAKSKKIEKTAMIYGVTTERVKEAIHNLLAAMEANNEQH